MPSDRKNHQNGDFYRYERKCGENGSGLQWYCRQKNTRMRSISFCKLELVLVVFLLEKNGFNLARAGQVTSYVREPVYFFLI